MGRDSTVPSGTVPHEFSTLAETTHGLATRSFRPVPKAAQDHTTLNCSAAG